jgi:two-component system chemotaxis response regulator CheB
MARRFELVVIGCSLGGMVALEQVLGALPASFPLPIAVVQHRYRTSGDALPAHIARHSSLKVVDVDDKQWMKPGTVYLAPANYHLLVE